MKSPGSLVLRRIEGLLIAWSIFLTPTAVRAQMSMPTTAPASIAYGRFQGIRHFGTFEYLKRDSFWMEVPPDAVSKLDAEFVRLVEDVYFAKAGLLRDSCRLTFKPVRIQNDRDGAQFNVRFQYEDDCSYQSPSRMPNEAEIAAIERTLANFTCQTLSTYEAAWRRASGAPELTIANARVATDPFGAVTKAAFDYSIRGSSQLVANDARELQDRAIELSMSSSGKSWMRCASPNLILKARGLPLADDGQLVWDSLMRPNTPPEEWTIMVEWTIPHPNPRLIRVIRSPAVAATKTQDK